MFIPANPTISILGKNPSAIDIASLFPFKVSDIYPSARTALQSALKKREGGKTVWLPAFMCRSLLKPIQSCGLNINYYDIDEKFMPELHNLKFSGGDYLLVVHFFGIRIPLEDIRNICVEKEVILIEDCAHILPNPDEICYAGTIGDISIFSFRKLFPVLYGGLVIEKEIFARKSSLSVPYVYHGIKKKVLMFIERLAFISGVNILSTKKKLRNIFGNTDSPVLSGELNVASYCAKNPMVSNVDTNYLKKVISRRKENYRHLYELIRNIDGIQIPFSVLPDGSCPQLFPILLRNRQDVFEKLIQCGIEAIIWPGKEKMQISLDNYPCTKFLDESLLLLPIHHGLQQKHINYIASSLRNAF